MERERSGRITWLRRRRGRTSCRNRLRRAAPAAPVARSWRPAIFAALTLIVFSDVLFAPGDLVLSEPRRGPRAPVRRLARVRVLGTPARQLPALEPAHLLRRAVLRRLSVRAAVPAELRATFSCRSRRRSTSASRCTSSSPGSSCICGRGGGGCSFLACLLCGALWMFCGEHYLHIMAGHLCRLIATAWIPLRLPGDRRSLRGPKPAMGAAGDLGDQHDDPRRRPAVRFLHRRRRGDLLRAVPGPAPSGGRRSRSGSPSCAPARRRSRPCSSGPGWRRPGKACADRAACRTSSPACSRSRRRIS